MTAPAFSRVLAVFGLGLLVAGCATPRKPVADLVDPLAAADVVFLGEIHDNSAGHVQQYQLLRLLHGKRPNLVLSMEMFERDVQDRVDAYLAGDLTEDEFLDKEKTRPWGNYRKHYRPLVEYAKEHGIPVVAANVPRSLASKVSAEGLAVGLQQEWAPKEASAPNDAYRVAFVDAMKGHMGVDSDSMQRFYEAQCIKDDAMAESIVTAYDRAAAAGGDRPLVVHVCGRFHSDAGLGTAARVSWRRPELRLEIVSMETESNVERRANGDWVLVVPPEPTFTRKKAPTTEGAAAGDGDPPDLGDYDPEGRPALGFMPDYDDEVVGVLVAGLRVDGPAERAGVEEGDVIVRVNAEDVIDVQSYMMALDSVSPGEVAVVRVERGNETLDLKVRVGSR